MNLITYLIENKLAKNEPHANAKIALLHLQDICNDESAVIARVELYEAHKASKLHGKNDRAICAEMAIKGIPVPKPVVDMFAELPQIGDVYEFDYVYNERGKTTERLIVVDVTDTHIMYKMPGVSVNKIFPMDHETWKANTDERRKVTE